LKHAQDSFPGRPEAILSPLDSWFHTSSSREVIADAEEALSSHFLNKSAEA
jgi:hypothetical protein